MVLGLAVVLPRALLDGEARVVLRRERADLLAVRDSDEGEGEECDGGEHGDAEAECL